MSTATSTETVTSKKLEVPALNHRLCLCQANINPSFAWCGARVGGGNGLTAGSVRPIEICVICTDIRFTDPECPYCNLRPSDYHQ